VEVGAGEPCRARGGGGAGEPRRGQVATATTRQWSGAWGSDEASGNSGGLERKRESEMRKKKGGEPLEMRLILRVGPTYRTVHFTVAGGALLEIV
jgi:hypothetical protein